MRNDMLKRYLFAAVLPMALLSACGERNADITSPAAADAPSSAPETTSEIARIRETITLPDMPPELTAMVADTFDNGPDPWRMTRQEVVAQFAASADAGDAGSAYIVGRRLAECHRILREDTPQSVLASYRDDLLELQQREGTPAYAVIRGNVERRFAGRVDGFADCSALTPGLIEKSAQWLERAAAAGHAGARKDYPSLAMAEFQTRDGIIRDAKEAQRRQTLARGYLEDAVQAGDRQALHTYADAQHGRGPLYPEDRRAAQVYGYVQQLAFQQPRTVDPRMAALQEVVDRERVARGGATRDETFQSLLRNGPDRYPPDAFSDAEWTEIAEEGRRIFETSFRTETPGS